MLDSLNHDSKIYFRITFLACNVKILPYIFDIVMGVI